VLEQLEIITRQKLNFVECDVRDSQALSNIFSKYAIKSVIHFAALKAVGVSVERPIEYYDNNLNGLLSLTKVMSNHKCYCLVFSSSATIYHVENSVPYVEDMKLGASNPYGWTKYMSEQILRDIEISCPYWKVAYLRYFNPVGAHSTGLIGEDPRDIPNNLMPYISKVAVGKLDRLSVYGGDWPTPDGTGIRDYVHVMDLALGHVKALNFLNSNNQSFTVNLGSGKGYSVLEVIRAFEKASSQKISFQIVERRAGDIASSYADASLAKKVLNWSADRDMYQVCIDSWRWQSQNPDGFNCVGY
jgi:UDP-glucose 4-epimerase